MRRRRRLLAALALVAAQTAPSLLPTPTASAVRSGSVAGWIPYWEVNEGVQAMTAAADRGLTTEVSPFWYSATGAISIRMATAPVNLLTVVRAARARGLTVIPSISDGTGKLAMQAILQDPVTRTQHVDTLVSLVTTGIDGLAYDGIDIDYEGFAFADGRATWPTTQPLWLAFVRELGEKLDAVGKLLSITVPPMWGDPKMDYTVYGPWNQITPYADRLRLMVYDWSVPTPGPIAPMSWVRKVIAEVQRQVPADIGKVWLGVPAYGRSWARITGTCPAQMPAGVALSTTSVETVNAADVAALHGATITETRDAAGNPEGEKTFSWDVVNPTTGGLTFTGPRTVTATPPPYTPSPTLANAIPAPAEGTTLAPAVRLVPVSTTVTCTIRRVVHFPDNASIIQRAQTAQAAGMGGIVMWAWGYEPADLWPALAAAP